MKSLVIYFSHKGENIVGDEIVYTEKGYTESLAEIIAKETGSDIFELEPLIPYSSSYDECNRRARDESERSIDVEAKSYPVSIDQYDTIYLGFPIWYRTFPRIIFSFLKKFDLKGKTIKPFATNEEGAFGYAEIQLMGLLNGVKVKDGLAIRSYEVNASIDKVKEWINK